MVKAGAFAVAVLLFVIGAFVDDPQAWWGIGFTLLALGLLADPLAAMTGLSSGHSDDHL
jgi:hypothetical protein